MTFRRGRLLVCLFTGTITTVIACAGPEEDPEEEDGTGGAASSGEGGGAGGGATGTGGAPGPCVFASDCVALSDACNIGTCINGMCRKAPANDGVACDDGKTCTSDDHCEAGTCTGTKKQCPSPDVCHVGDCDLETDTCIVVPGNDGVGCVDDDACTATSFCQDGVCAPGTPTDCSFLDTECTVGACDPRLGCMSMPKNDGAPCDDGLFCTIDDTCQAGTCAGEPNPCAPPGDVCKIGSCNEVLDSCVSVPGNDGAACDDQNACTTNTTCAGGTCGGGVPANEGGACDDKQACTTADTCQAGVCTGTPVTVCQNGDGCCPSGCDVAVDDDCGGNVYITSANGDVGFYGYDVSTNTWTVLPPPPSTTHTQLTTDGTHVILLGDDNQIHSFDPATTLWSSIGFGPDPFLAGQPIGFFEWTPNGLYYLKDGDSTLFRSVGNVWTKVALSKPMSSAGTYDPVSQRLYVRGWFNFDLLIFDTTTNTEVGLLPNPTFCDENSRTGAFLDGFFYVRAWSTPFTKIDVMTGAASLTNVTPSEAHTSTDVDLEKGDVYIGPYQPTGTTFQKYNPATGVLTTLAPVPVPVLNHSTIVFVPN